MRLLKSKRNIFFSTCIATVLVLFTLVFIINRSLSYNDLLNTQKEVTISHVYIEGLMPNDIGKIKREVEVNYLGQVQYYDGNKDRSDKYFTLINIDRDILKIHGLSLLNGRFPDKGDEVIL